MFRTKKREITNFESDIKFLYLLAFLLTTNHEHAEQCFVATIDAAFKQQAVFKQWARTWIKRRLIKNAIQIVSPASGMGKRESSSPEQPGTHADGEIDAVIRLAPLERFIFVMSVLERYSIWECFLLLGCDMKKVVQVRMRALRRLAGQDAVPPWAEAIFSRGMQATA